MAIWPLAKSIQWQQLWLSTEFDHIRDEQSSRRARQSSADGQIVVATPSIIRLPFFLFKSNTRQYTDTQFRYAWYCLKRNFQVGTPDKSSLLNLMKSAIYWFGCLSCLSFDRMTGMFRLSLSPLLFSSLFSFRWRIWDWSVCIYALYS